MSRHTIHIAAFLVMLFLITSPTLAQGGTDLHGYCESMGFARATLVDQNAYGWRCESSNGELHGIYMEDVCAWQYGGSLPVARARDYNDPFSWGCFAADQSDNGGSSEPADPPDQPAPPAPPGNDSAPASPSVSGPSISRIDACQYAVAFNIGSFAPNSMITVRNDYSEVSCMTGEVFNNVFWTDTTGPTNETGNLYISYIHGGTGNYRFTFTDQQGNSAAVSFSTQPSTDVVADPTGADVMVQVQDDEAGGNTGGGANGNSQVGVQPDEPDLSQIPFVGFASPPSGTQWVKVVLPEGIFVRSGPGTETEIIGRTGANTDIYFELIETASGWHHVRWNGGQGWVSAGSQHTTTGTSHVAAPPACPSGVGPDGITAGDYPPQRLSQEQRQWLWNVFGHTGTASVGYGGERCGESYDSSWDNFVAMVCRRGHTGPGGIRPGGCNSQDLTQEQRNFLYHEFGNTGEASVGYGGERCPNQQQNYTVRDVFIAQVCAGGHKGPNGMAAGSYNPEDLTQAERQWLWNTFGNDPNETAPAGYGGQRCPGQTQNLPAPVRISPPNGGGDTVGDGCPSASSRLHIGDIAVATSSELNLREHPRLGAAVIQVMQQGTQFTIVSGPSCSDNILWWQIGLSDGRGGFAAEVTGNGSYLMAPNQAAPPVAEPPQSEDGGENQQPGAGSETPQEEISTTPRLEPIHDVVIFSGPNITYVQMGTISPGTSFNIVGKNGNSMWLQIDFGSQRGWVCRAGVRDNGLVFLVPVTSTSQFDCAGNTTADADPISVDIDQYDLEEPCVALSSATLISVGGSEVTQCVATALDEYMTDDELFELTQLMIDCGVISGAEVVQFVANIGVYGDPVIAAAVSFTPESTANCISDFLEMLVW